MSTAKRKVCNELTIEKKKDVIDSLEKGVSQRNIASQFNISKTTVVNISKKKQEILKAWEENCSHNRKRKFRKTEHEAINNTSYEFFLKCRAAEIPVTGPMLQTKAKEIAQRLQIDNFQASNGWLDAFRSRHNIRFGCLSGEAAGVNLAAAEDWKVKLPDVCKNYAPEDIFNADETGLFYRQVPRKSLIKKGDKCKGGKLAKQRLSVLLCCSMTGEKLKPLVIGNAARPRAFKNVDLNNLPVEWKSNKKSWMTLSLFEEWVNKVNVSMKKQKRKILLLVDNATSHNVSNKKLSNVELKFLPPNLTSEIQPLDQGIIRAVKSRYRQHLLQFIVSAAENSATLDEFLKSVTVLHAIRWLSSAWDQTSKETCVKCFRRAGFVFGDNVQSTNDVQSDDVSFSELIAELPQSFQADLASATEIVSLDDELIVHEELATTPDAVLEEIFNDNTGGGGEKEEECSDNDSEIHEKGDQTEIPVPTHSEALKCVDQLIKYCNANHSNVVKDLFQLYTDIEMKMLRSKMSLKQTHMNDFLNTV